MTVAVCEPDIYVDEKRTFTSAKIGVDVYRDIKTLAAFYGLDANDYLTDMVEPIVAQRMAKMGEEIAARSQTIRHARSQKRH
jgi:methyl coenzyme M reductase alpha subunit